MTSQPPVPAPGDSWFPALHTLRGIAAIWVMLFHLWGFAGYPPTPVSWLFSVGWLGVHLFYALSAFLLGLHFFSRQLAGRRWTYRSFLLRRTLRIFPAYYVQLGILLVAAAFFGFRQMPGLSDLAAHLVMWFHLPPGIVQPLNGVRCTLPIEFAFYLLLPVLGRLIMRFGLIPFILLAVAVTISYRWLVFQSMSDQPIPAIASIIGQLPGVMTVFACGLAAAWLTAQGRIPSFPPRTVALVAAVLCGGWIQVLLWQLDGYWQGSLLLWTWESINAPLFALIIVALARLPAGSSWLTHRVGVWLGEVSYGIYLWHLPLILVLRPLLPENADPLLSLGMLSLLVTPLTLLLAMLTYQVVEKRAIALGRSWSRRYHSHQQ